jgi:hypothetical protein
LGPMVTNPPRVELSATDLRTLYAQSNYPQRIKSSELDRYVTWERRLPGGGFSRIITYTEKGQTAKLLVVHQRVRKDGTTTQPDPKQIVWQDVTYWTR